MAISLGTALTIATAVAATTAIAGGVVGGVASIAEHNQAKANAKAQEQQAEYNKRQEMREAARVEAETAENARRQREQSEYLKAQQRALLGKSGAAMTSGSPLAILGATAADEELKVQDIHRVGYQQAQNHREAAKMYEYQAGMARAQAPSRSSLALSLAGNVANTVGTQAKIFGNWAMQNQDMRNQGTWKRSVF